MLKDIIDRSMPKLFDNKAVSVISVGYSNVSLAAVSVYR
jgi:hypothetical protein